MPRKPARKPATNASRTAYHVGQRVVLKANRREGWPRQEGTYLGKSGSIAMVQLDAKYCEGDDDGLREVDWPQMLPHYAHPMDQRKRADHAARMFRNGVRIFRLGMPDGPVFCVESIDVKILRAYGRISKRKTVQSVLLGDLFPNVEAR